MPKSVAVHGVWVRLGDGLVKERCGIGVIGVAGEVIATCDLDAGKIGDIAQERGVVARVIGGGGRAAKHGMQIVNAGVNHRHLDPGAGQPAARHPLPKAGQVEQHIHFGVVGRLGDEGIDRGHTGKRSQRVHLIGRRQHGNAVVDALGSVEHLGIVGGQRAQQRLLRQVHLRQVRLGRRGRRGDFDGGFGGGELVGRDERGIDLGRSRSLQLNHIGCARRGRRDSLGNHRRRVAPQRRRHRHAHADPHPPPLDQSWPDQSWPDQALLDQFLLHGRLIPCSHFMMPRCGNPTRACLPV